MVCESIVARRSSNSINLDNYDHDSHESVRLRRTLREWLAVGMLDVVLVDSKT